MTQSLENAREKLSGRDLSPNPVREQARAKVNLTLHVEGKRPDGYHELESLVVFADLCDEVTFIPGATDSISLDGPFAGAVEGENLVLKAKRAVAGWLGSEITGAFRIQKNIPVAAGLGGGSSDAAAAIRALLKIHPGSLEPAAFMQKSAIIGADVPVCLHHRAAFMRGLGEKVTPVTDLVALPAVLVNPRLPLSTAAVFKRLNAPLFELRASAGSEPLSTKWADPKSAAKALQQARNDLEAPAIALQPAVRSVLGALASLDGCLLARLSGSGPTCFGLFQTPEAAQAGARALELARPQWWIAPTVLS